jgi:hypothetical protein
MHAYDFCFDKNKLQLKVLFHIIHQLSHSSHVRAFGMAQTKDMDQP